MTCPKCGSERTHCINSRPNSAGRRRRYECWMCDQRFSTLERITSEKTETKDEAFNRIIRELAGLLKVGE